MLDDALSASLSTWYTNFFTELPNMFWRSAVPSKITAAEVDFITRGLPPGARVLDVPCGSGRHSLELARRGFRVTGLDLSAEAIGYAKRAAAVEGLHLDLRLADMRALPAGLVAEAAVCLGNSFGYLEHDHTQRFLAHIRRALVPGGRLIIDYGAVAEALLPHAEGERRMSAGGVDVEAVNTYDAVRGRQLTNFTFRRGDEVRRGTSVQYVYTAAELGRLVCASGFTDVELYGDPSGEPFRLDSPRLLLVARVDKPPKPSGR